MKSKIAALATTEKVLLFNSIGIDSYVVTNENVSTKIKKLLKEDIKIFIISENLNDFITEIKNDFIDTAYPLFLLLPIDNKHTNAGTLKIEKDVEKAIGINIFKED